MTKYCAIDCEMDKSEESSVVIKVSLVNEHGHVLIDTYVNPEQEITENLSDIHGISIDEYQNKFVPKLSEV